MKRIKFYWVISETVTTPRANKGGEKINFPEEDAMVIIVAEILLSADSGVY